MDRRLDLDIDELLTSPKLELKLSPAELDKQCLELYEQVADGPGGDLLRIIGGGNDVAMQHRYMKRKARNELREARSKNSTAPFFLDDSVDSPGDKSRTASQWVRWAMRRNLPTNGTFAYTIQSTPTKAAEDDTNSPTYDAAPKQEEHNLQMFRAQSGPRLYSTGPIPPSKPWGGVPIPSHRWMTSARLQAAKRSARGLSLLI